METTQPQTRTFEFIAPSGHSYTIREQNGEDDDILSNPVRAKTLQNLSDFASGLIVTNTRNSGRLTSDEIQELPALDRYVILFNSRVFSIGKDVDFEFDWGKENGGIAQYEVDLNDFLFDYSSVPTEEVLNSKPNAVPFYPAPEKEKGIEINLTSGKVVSFDLLSGTGETYMVSLPIKTKNSELKARNLKLSVQGKFEVVENFRLFSVKDMMEIRAKVNEYDPIFAGQTDIENPHKSDQKTIINVVAIPGFFYPGEI